jgi:hypothetical protein
MMGDQPTNVVACIFSVRAKVANAPTYRYDRVYLSNPRGDGYLHTPHPPRIGDQIYLYDQRDNGPRGEFRVLARSWRHSSWGSANWPILDAHATEPAHLDILVECCDGVFADEEPDDEEADDEEARDDG